MTSKWSLFWLEKTLFGGVKAKNRGQTGSRNIIYIYIWIYSFTSRCLNPSHDIWIAYGGWCCMCNMQWWFRTFWILSLGMVWKPCGLWNKLPSLRWTKYSNPGQLVGMTPPSPECQCWTTCAWHVMLGGVIFFCPPVSTLGRRKQLWNLGCVLGGSSHLVSG